MNAVGPKSIINFSNPTNKENTASVNKESSSEPSAPPFERTEDDWLREYHIWENCYKPIYECLRTAYPYIPISAESYSLTFTPNTTMAAQTKHPSRSSETLIIKNLKKELSSHMSSKNYDASYKILKQAEVDGHLPKLWDTDNSDSQFNKYIGEVIQKAFAYAKNSSEKAEILFDNQKLHFHLSPFKNLQNAYLEGINLEGFYLYEVNFKNADLTQACLASTCINVYNLLLAKSLRAIETDEKIIRLSTPLEKDPLLNATNVKLITRPVKLSAGKIEMLKEKIVKDYTSYFRKWNVTSQEISNALIELENIPPSYSLVRDPLPYSPIFLFSKPTAYQQIKQAAQDEIDYKQSPKTNPGSNAKNDFQTLANAYDGSY